MSTLDDLNEDWIKTLHWDLPDDLDGFLRVVGDRSDVEHFLTLPAAMAMPVGLRLDIEHWMSDHPTDSPAAPAPAAVPRPAGLTASVTATGISFEHATTVEFWSEDQPRDADGRWGGGDAGTGGGQGEKVGGGQTNYGGIGQTHPADAEATAAHLDGVAAKTGGEASARAAGQAAGIREAHASQPIGLVKFPPNSEARNANPRSYTHRDFMRSPHAPHIDPDITARRSTHAAEESVVLASGVNPDLAAIRKIVTAARARAAGHAAAGRRTLAARYYGHAEGAASYHDGLVDMMAVGSGGAADRDTDGDAGSDTDGDGFSVRAVVTASGIVFDYNPDQERGPDGRWGGGGDSKQAALERAKIVEGKVKAALDKGLATDMLHEHGTDGLPPGKYTPEREAMHDRIIDQFMQKSEGVPRDRQAVFSGGLPGAGKSSMLAQAGIDEHNYLTVNPDEMKEAIIREGGLPRDPALDGLKPMEQAGIIHEESSALAMRLADEASARGTNLVWDITMNKASSVNERLDRLPGYTTKAMFVEVTTETSKASAMDRYLADAHTPEGGRFIDPRVIDGMRDPTWGSVNRATFEETKSRFDSYELWSREHGEAPKLVEKHP